MTPLACQLLDDYLAHDLAGDERARFTAHLAHCSDCLRAVHEQQRLEHLLAAAVTKLEPVPAELTQRIERRLRAERRRRVVAAVAAALLIVAVLWQLGRFAPRPKEPELLRTEVQPSPPAAQIQRPDQLVRVTFPPNANVIVVPEETGTPNMTFLWVHRGLRGMPAPAAATDRPN